MNAPWSFFGLSIMSSPHDLLRFLDSAGTAQAVRSFGRNRSKSTMELGERDHGLERDQFPLRHRAGPEAHHPDGQPCELTQSGSRQSSARGQTPASPTRLAPGSDKLRLTSPERTHRPGGLQMGFLAGKRAFIVGVATERSIAWGIAQAMHRGALSSPSPT